MRDGTRTPRYGFDNLSRFALHLTQISPNRRRRIMRHRRRRNDPAARPDEAIGRRSRPCRPQTRSFRFGRAFPGRTGQMQDQRRNRRSHRQYAADRAQAAPPTATGCTILGKAEFMNPGQSVKDRAARQMILEAEKRGEHQAGRAGGRERPPAIPASGSRSSPMPAAIAR